jgi:hypothetical protein
MHQPANAQLLPRSRRSTSSSTKRPSPGRWPWKTWKPFCPRSAGDQHRAGSRQGWPHYAESARRRPPRSRRRLVQNLEHSKHFLLPRIVGESSESTGGPNERLEPISASNRVNFELLAEYNPAAPMEHKAQKKQEDEKPSADGDRASQSALSSHAAHPAQAPATPGKKSIPPPSTRLGRSKPNPSRGPNPNPNSGGPR